MTGARSADLVIPALRDRQFPDASAGWDLLIRQARAAGLLARLGGVIDAHGLAHRVPAGPAAHFEAAARYAQAQQAEVRREVAYVQRALSGLDVPVVLLKGAAYLLAGLPAHRGRLFSDTDILVPKARLADVESALLINGWATTHHSAYDQRYYREWMHELPPLVHLRRQTALDVHHAISPETARLRPSSAFLLASAVPISGQPGLATLAPEDMVLHSMLHLLVNDELSHGLRDLSDLDLLLRHFGADGAFWPRVAARARQLGLGLVLHDGCRFAVAVLGTPVPADAMNEIAAAARAPWADRAMASLWHRALRSPHRSTADALSPAASFALYLRAHWVRMPPLMLARHLAVKALRLNRPPENAAGA